MLCLRSAFGFLLITICLFVGMMTPALALEDVVFEVPDTDGPLRDVLVAASLVEQAKDKPETTAREVYAAAISDYGRLTEALYGEGYYGGVVTILIDGRDAAGIAPFAIPSQIKRVKIKVAPGPVFQFGSARVTPLVPGYALPDDFRQAQPAKSGAVQAALDGAAEAWRAAGHAKVALTGQILRANHASNRLTAELRLDPGPKVRFGQLVQDSESAVRRDRIQRIAGLPSGQVFSPEVLRKVAKRLRRTGAFASVSLSEAETLGPGDVMDIGLSLVDEVPRRFGAGAEWSTLDGLTLSGFWMHRNFLGGAERFRVDGEVSGIAGQGGVDYTLGARLDQPATFGPDTGGFLFGKLSHEDEPGYTSQKSNWVAVSVGSSRTV